MNKKGAGTVSSSMAGIDCGTKCSSTYTPSTQIILTATPAPNLISWGDACSGSTATCTVTMDAAKSVTVTFKDTPLITGLPTNLTFPLQNKGSTSAAQSLMLTNTGTAALTISSMTTTGDFAVTNNCGSGLGVAGFCTLNVSFSPTATGARTGTLTITSNAPGSPHIVNLSGSGQGAVVTFAATPSIVATPPSGFGALFGNTNLGASSALAIKLVNTGGDILNIDSLTISGDFAKSTTCNSTLDPDASCTITVTFSPTVAGDRTGSLVINSNSAYGNIKLGLNGTGVAVPVVSLSPASLSFTEPNVATISSAQRMTLTNSGGAALNLSSITASGDFAVTHNCGSGLGAAGFCNLSVTFAPKVAGNRIGAITIISNAPGSPHTLALSGSTPAPAITALDLLKGWNLLGNGQDQPVTIATLFGDAQNVTTVWKWDVVNTGWQFYTPIMDAATLQSYATSKGYGVLTSINPGEGFWVNALQPFSVTRPSSSAITGNEFAAGKSFALKSSWNLVAIGTALTPSDFNKSLSVTPPATGTVPFNITTLWAWDNPLSKWYFYTPHLEAQGGAVLFDYTANKGYLDFTVNSKTLGSGVGFWVNNP